MMNDDLQIPEGLDDLEDTTHLVYICSAHTGNPMEVELFDRFYCNFAAEAEEETPVAPYLIFPQFFNEKLKVDKIISRNCALKLLSKCDELWVMQGGGITAEMADEIKFAMTHGIPIRYRVLEFTDVEPDDVALKQLGVPNPVDAEVHE